MSYAIYGACMVVGMIATWFAKEPERADAGMVKKEREATLWTWRGFFDAVVGPFIAFFRAHGWLALVMLAAISLYRLPDFIMGPMANPYYHDIGLSKQTVGAVRGSIGLIATFAGIAAGGFCSLKLGYMRALIIGGIVQATAIAAYATLAFAGTTVPLFALVMAGPSFFLRHWVTGIGGSNWSPPLPRKVFTRNPTVAIPRTVVWALQLARTRIQ
jgi:PAT family beta-lactamase induction signal transducer AmpG